MEQKPKPNINKNQVILPILLALMVVTYFYFSSYKPKVPENTQDVMGVQTQNSDLPRLLNAETISYNKSSNSEHFVFQTSASSEEVMEFYQTALTKRGWKTEEQGLSDSFSNFIYKKNNDLITISISKQKFEQGEGIEYTLVSVTLQNN